MLKESIRIKEETLKEEFKFKIGHNLSDGKHRESLIQMLLDFIPARYQVCNGFIFDSHGNKSKEIDLIVFDNLYVPNFFRKSSYSLIPIESVVAIIQVKTSLSKSEFESAIDNLNSIDILIPEKGGKIISASTQIDIIQENRIIAPLKILVARNSNTPLINREMNNELDFIYIIDGNDYPLIIKKNKPDEIVSKSKEYIDLINIRKKNTDKREYNDEKLYHFIFNLLCQLTIINNALIINYEKYGGLNE